MVIPWFTLISKQRENILKQQICALKSDLKSTVTTVTAC